MSEVNLHIPDSWKKLGDREYNIVYTLGETMGFGRIMQLAEECWRDYLKKNGYPEGSEHTTGPCKCFIIPCVCREEGNEEMKEAGCDWCFGCGKLTKTVYELVRKEIQKRDQNNV